jgi:hypothetical protein
MLQLDHIALAAETLEEGGFVAESRLGVPLLPGGVHPRFGTHNRLLGLADGLYLEVIAIDASVPGPPEGARWFDLDRFKGPPRLANWICRTNDLDAMISRFPAAGTAVALSRGDLNWRMAVPRNGILPFDNMFPALMQWECTPTPAQILPGSGCRLTRLTVSHPEVCALADALSTVLVDDRIVFRSGPARLGAEIETPDGTRLLA